MKNEYTYDEINDLIMSLSKNDLTFLEDVIRERKKQLRIIPCTTFCLQTDNGRVWLDTYEDLISAFYEYIFSKALDLSFVENKLHYQIADKLEKDALKNPICFKYDYMNEFNGINDAVILTSIRLFNGDETYTTEKVFPISEDEELQEHFNSRYELVSKKPSKTLIK